MKHGRHSYKIMRYHMRKRSLNEVTNIWDTCSIKDTSQDPELWVNELYNFNLKLKKSSRNVKNMNTK